MKKFSFILIALLTLCTGVLFSACTPNEKVSVTLSATNVQILLGETENNSVTVTANLTGATASKLGLDYDRSSIVITQVKNSDGTFALTIKSLVERGTNPISVQVKYGDIASATFYVEVIIPIQSIVADENAYIPYDGQKTTCDLENLITCLPEGTKQTDVEFTLAQENENWSVAGNILTVNANIQNLNNIETIKIYAVSKVENKDSVRAELNVALVPNIRLLSNTINVTVDYNANTSAPTGDEYKLFLTNNNGTYVINTFEVKISVPSYLGLDVDVDTTLTPNILSLLSYERLSNLGATYDIYTFKFNAKSSLQGAGGLRFKYSYKKYADESSLIANFVCKTADEEINKLDITVVTPITAISVNTDCVLNSLTNQYAIYQSYSNNMGERFTFSTSPENTSQNTLKLTISEEDALLVQVRNSNGQLILGNPLDDGEPILSAEIKASDAIYIKGITSGQMPTIKCESLQNSEVYSTLAFEIKDGATGLGFVPDLGSTTLSREIALNVEVGVETTAYIFANGAQLSDIISDAKVGVNSVAGDGNEHYFIAKFKESVEGVYSYTFKTANGYTITAIINAIQPLTSAIVQIKNNPELVEGIGDYFPKSTMQDLESISLKNGYSVELAYTPNDGAVISKIEYSYYEEVVDIYSNDQLEAFKSSPENKTFKKISSCLNTQNLSYGNIITASSEGVSLVKIEIYGQKVENSEIVVEVKDTKYLFVQVYNPAKSIQSSSKNISLRVQSQVQTDGVDNTSLFTKTISVDVLSDADKSATYDKVFINRGKITTVGEDLVCTYTRTSADSSTKLFTVEYNYTTKQLTITALNLENNVGGAYSFSVFAGDFVNYDTNTLVLESDVKKDIKKYTFTITLVETKAISEIYVSNLALKEETQTTKTYESIYIDTKDTNSFKIITNVQPSDAFNKTLVYDYIPSSGQTQASLVIEDGIVRVVGKYGGTGVITIKPQQNPNNDIKTIEIPIVIADGNSWQTAYEITSLSQITQNDKHYVLSIPATYTLNSSLFESSLNTFSGGLYGRRYVDRGNDNVAMATIRLNKVSLFNVLAQSAYIADLNICGDVTEYSYTQSGSSGAINFVNRGFVANVNYGTIENVNITSYVLDGVYVPSMLTVGEGAQYVGGIVGQNMGTINNCKFAGSINVSQNKSVIVDAIAGTGNGSTISCKIVISKYDESLAQSGRVVKDGEVYTNGIVGSADTFVARDGVNVEKYTDYTFSGNVWIKEYNDGLLKHSYGKEESKEYGLVFYYKAQDVSEQNNQSIQKVLARYNTISLQEMLNIENGKLNVSNLKIVALNTDNTPCDFVTVNSGSITLNGVGRFKLIISTEYDYTVSYEINMLSMYYASSFTINSSGVTIDANSGSLELISGQTHDIITRLNGTLTITLSDGTMAYIQLMQNDFQVAFSMSEDADASAYITSTSLGLHTINITSNWTWNNSIKIKTTLVSGYGNSFDNLINVVFATETTGAFSVTKKVGTTQIQANISQGAIEPKDTFSFVATISTDMSTDQITANSVKIFNEQNIDITAKNYFNIYVEQVDTYKYKIYINVNFDNMGNVISYVDKTYKVVVYAIGDAGKLYDANTSVSMQLLPQTISDLSASIYTITTQTTTGINVSSKEVPTSVLIPSGPGGVLAIDMFPAYASFDYIEIVAESSTMSKLSFRLLERMASGVDYQNISTGYESIDGKNGIRIFNDQNYDIQNIGSYYVKLFTDATFDTDTIFNLSIIAYYQGEQLPSKTVLTLYVRMPEVPVLSLDGETTIYALAGQSIDGITALISEDQVNPYAKISCLENGDSVIDRKPTSNIKVTMQQVSQNSIVGYKRYIIYVSFKDGYSIDIDSTRFTLVVTSTKIVNGTEIPVSAEMHINIVDYVVKDGDIVISNAIENTFKVTGLKYEELKINELVDVSATEDFVEKFNTDYYFNNDKTAYSFGSNTKKFGDLNKVLDNKAYVLASYLSFVEGSSKYPLLKVNSSGEFELESTDYLTFNITEDDRLMVKGGTHTGTTNMVLEIKYQLPDGKIYTIEYNFTIVHSLYTTEDLPREIANVDDFLGISNETDAQDYILTNDLYLYDFTTIDNTSKMTSFDGNNYTINIVSFAESETATNFALFNSISSNTTIKNLTINLYYLQEIPQSSVSKSINVASVAITNYGSIYNCEVVSFKADALSNITATHGIKINEQTTAEVAGFVLNNKGSITNSRVGGSTKLVTRYDYDDNKVISTTKAQTMLTIRASGNLYGFVGTNDGIISSSFVKNINIQNTYTKQDLTNTAGFVGENSKQISMSYVEGAFADEQDVQATLGGLEGSGVLSGFVITNKGSISDCYSNLLLTNSRQQVGRLGAGFVYYNSQEGTIDRCYSASKIVDNNVSQMNFVGITDFGGYNNDGQIKTSYYYIESTNDIVTIEGVLNDSLKTVSNVSDTKEFYGFNFVNDSTPGTWAISSSNRPQIVSADDISHSVRAKYELDNDDNNLGYVFSYCDGYELGTANNPIIIRNAKEFNSVFGGSTSTDISANYNLISKKVYGNYRLVNDIDMLELVPEVEAQGDYKVNLISTTLTLTGEYQKSTNRAGSINGNGLTISNLAISNSSQTSDSFGLFKSIENGASICNLNIELAKGGVSADHTTFVGTIAGSLVSSYAYNITVNSHEASTYINVVGANVSGGVFGRVIGMSNVANITVNNVSVVSTFNTDYSYDTIKAGINRYDRDSSTFSDISIAGGAFGVIDIYPADSSGLFISNKAEDALSASAQSISVFGGMKIQAMTVGGVVGYVGELVSMRDVSLTLTNTALPAVINAYNCYAGGIAGYSEGYIYQFRAEHQEDWQQTIEDNIHNYYTSSEEQRAQIDRGSENLFESNVNYSPFAIGGIVGYQRGGKLNIGYSKINVINENASNVGGVIGYVSAKPTTDNEVKTGLIIVEVYAIGDVYSGKKDAHISGIIGYNADSQTTLNKVNALNYWGEKTRNVQAFTTGEAITAENVCSLVEVKFNNEDPISLGGSVGDGISSYYDYEGIASDDGAQIDLMFKQKQWYVDGNWSRDVNENYPHINYVSPQNRYIIETTKDFIKFSLYGYDPTATFIIVGEGEEGLVNCKNWQTTLGAIKAQIIGVSGKNGFTNLNTNLFASAINTSISNLRFVECNASLVRSSDNVKYSNLLYDDCEFKIGSDNKYGGVTTTVKGSCSFTGITFNDCNLSASGAQSAGLLFAEQIDEAITNISNITVKSKNNSNTSVKISNPTKGDFGILFGYASIGKKEGSTYTSVMKSINLSNAKLSISIDKDKLSISTYVLTDNINVGAIGGRASTFALSTDDCSFDNTSISVDCNSINSDKGVYVGGLIGNVTNDVYLEQTEENNSDNTKYIAVPIMTSNMENIENEYMGGLFGIVVGQGINVSVGNGMLIVGKSSANSTEYAKLSCSAGKKNTYVGGIAGHLKGISSNASDGKPRIAFVGDLVTVENENSNGYIDIGGIAGYISAGTISNVYYDGTISLSNATEGANVRAGGIVGYVQGDVTVNNALASGEIIVPEITSTSTTDISTHNYAGVVGADGGTLTIKNASILTTIFNKANTPVQQDVVVNKLSEAELTLNNVKYSATLTLATSAYESAKNVMLADIKGEFEALTGYSIIGSKLNPYTIGEILEGEHQGYNFGDSTNNAPNKYGYSKTESDKLTLKSTYLRKMYVTLDGLADNTLNMQLSLENTVLFSDGSENSMVYSEFTPINLVDEDSVVSSVIVGLMCKQENSNIVSCAGLVNSNEGMVYLSSVQETLNKYQTVDVVTGKIILTQFNAMLYLSQTPNFTGIYPKDTRQTGVAGFVAYNAGYIFGCSTNIAISIKDSKAKINASGFVGLNKGTISYCYASGSIDNINGMSYLFAPHTTTEGTAKFEGSFDNSYSIVSLKHATAVSPVKDKYGLPSNISNKLPTGVLSEQDAVQVQLEDNSTTLFNGIQRSETSTITIDKYDTKEYYNCDNEYNYGYPTLSAGVFKKLTFLKRSTLVTADDIGGKYNKYTSGDSAYAQIPNLTVLKTLGGSSYTFDNYVLINDITPCYTYSPECERIALTNKLIDTIGVNDNTTSKNGVDNTTSEDGVTKTKTIDFNNRQISYVLLNGCNLINKVGENVTLKKMQFAGCIDLNGSTGIIGIVNTGATLSSVIVNSMDVKVKLSDSVGVIVQVNKGTIQNVTFSGNITSDGKYNNKEDNTIFGGVVGTNKNNGTVENGQFLGTVVVDEKGMSSGSNLIFGAFIGKNKGTAKQLQLSTSKTNAFTLLSDYADEKMENNHGGEMIDGGYENGLASSYITSYYETSIYVRTNAQATVGGIVGKMVNGSIEQCATTNKNYDATFSTGTTPTKTSTILVGDEYYQMLAYAGGIVGEVTGGKVTDCANLANVTAMSVWLFVNNASNNAVCTATYDNNKTYSFKLNSNLGTDVFASDAEDSNSSAMAYFDQDSGCIFIYREMWSLAYAGGIAGKGITSAENDVNETGTHTHLLNYGTISAGYRSIKPVLRIEAEKMHIEDLSTAILISSVPILVIGTAFPWVGLAMTASMAVIQAVVEGVAKTQIKTPTLYPTAFAGNSVSYHVNQCGDKYGYIRKVFNKVKEGNPNDAEDNFDCEVLNKALGWREGLDKDDNRNAKKAYQKALSKFVYPYMDRLSFYSSFDSDMSSFTMQGSTTAFKENTSFVQGYNDENSKYCEFKIINGEGDIIVPYYVNSDGEEYHNLPTYYSDGICPEISGADLQVYSKETNLISNDESSYSLHSGNPWNEKIRYDYTIIEDNGKKSINTLLFDKYNVKDKEKYSNYTYIPASETIPTWDEDKWTLINDYYMPVNLNSLINVQSKDNSATDLIFEKDGKYSYTLSDPSNWRNIVYTINYHVATLEKEIADLNDKIEISTEESQIQEWKDELDAKTKELNAWLTMTINVDTGNNHEISVQSNTLKKFNGTINFINSDCYFIDLILAKSLEGATTNLGLIEQTEGCTLQGVNVKGSVKITIAGESVNTASTERNVNVGLLIGQASGTVNITNCSIQTDTIYVSDQICNKISNLGLFIGSVTEEKSKVTITNSSLGDKDNVLELNARYIEDTSNSSALGAIVGLIDTANVTIDGVNTYAKITSYSNFNFVGGIVGKATNGAKIVMSEKTISELNTTLEICGSNDTYVGGIVGYLDGSNLTFNGDVIIGSKNSISITADVMKSAYCAYAGGVAGGSDNSTISFNDHAEVTIGNTEAGSYENVNYILAGYLKSEANAFPSNSNASASIGWAENSTINNPSINTYKCIIKHIKCDESITDDSKDKTGDIKLTLILTKSNSGDTNDLITGEDILEKLFKQKQTDTGSDLGNNEFGVNTKEVISIPTSDSNGISAKYNETDMTLTEQIATNDNYSETYAYSLTMLEQYESLIYSCEEIKSDVTSSDSTGVRVYEWKLSIAYVKDVKQVIDSSNDAKNKYQLELTYDYKIVLSVIQQKITDEYKVCVEVIQLNNYTISKEKVGTVNISKKEIAQYSEDIYKESATVDDSYNKTIISLSYDYKDVKEGITYKLTDDIFNPALNASYSSEISEVKNDGDDEVEVKEGNTTKETQKYTMTSYVGTLNFVSWDITLKEQKQSLTFELSQSLVNNVETDKLAYTLDVTKENGTVTKSEITVDDTDFSHYSSTYTYSLNLINKQDINCAELKGVTTMEGYTPPTPNYTVILNDDVIKGETSYSDDVTLYANDAFKGITIDCKKPTYMMNGEKYNNVQFQTLEHNNGNSYLIISCSKNDGNSGNIEYTDYIYQKDGNNYYSCGYIKYTVVSGSVIIGESRYDSFFPQISPVAKDKPIEIINVSSNLHAKNTETIEMYVYYYDATLDIFATEGNRYYSYTITYSEMKCQITIDDKIIVGTAEATNDNTIVSEATIRLTSKNSLEGLIDTEKIECATEPEKGYYTIYEKGENLPGLSTAIPSDYKELIVYRSGDENYHLIGYTKEIIIDEETVVHYYYYYNNQEEESKDIKSIDEMEFWIIVAKSQE